MMMRGLAGQYPASNRFFRRGMSASLSPRPQYCYHPPSTTPHRCKEPAEMAQPLDLDAYLARINYSGPRTPTYDTLAGILRAHTASIPFESFDVLLGRPIRLDPEGLQAK